MPTIDQALAQAARLAASGQLSQAEALYRAVLKQAPMHPNALQGLNGLKSRQSPDPAVQLFRQGKFAEAAKAAENALRKAPNELKLLNLLGAAEMQRGRLDAAIAAYGKALKIRPDYAPAHNNLGLAHRAAGHPDRAIDSYRAALRHRPGYVDALNNLGVALQETGRTDEAIASLQDAIAAAPENAQAYGNLATAQQQAGDLAAAIKTLRQAIARAPSAESHCNLGKALRDVGDLPAAIEAFRAALTLDPTHLEAYLTLGPALRRAGRRDEALQISEQGVAKCPPSADLQLNIATLHQDLGGLDKAAEAFDAALKIDPDHPEATAQALYLKAHLCDFDGVATLAPRIPALGIDTGPVVPFSLLAFDEDPTRQLKRAEAFAARYPAAPPPAVPKQRPDRLTIGYFSADFHAHATMHLMARLFELHDTARFRILAFSFGPDRQDDMRARLTAAVDGFHDIRTLPDREAAALARREGVDIAVDLKGYTKDARPGVFAQRAAPIQINYLGYPGTMGAPFIDYVIADPTLIPPEDPRHYSEAVITLPNCYQVNDDRRQIAPDTPSRADLGLPEDALVLCCFNSSYKISADLFAIWMRILGQAPDAVLWLLGSNTWAEANLRQAAQAHGIDPTRLVFAGRLPPAEHLARHRAADLFLDTFAYTAHTTASDALRAGLPIVTRRGHSFAARVTSSMLTVLDLADLIAPDAHAYEALALDLTQHPRRLAEIRAKLAAAIPETPLFNSALSTRHIEAAYEAAFDRLLAGKPPAPLAIGA